MLGGLGLSILTLTGCGQDDDAPAPPSLEWDAKKYGPEPAHRALSVVTISTEPGWVVAREKAPVPASAPAATPASSTARLRIGGVDCGDCQRLVADELGMVVGVRQVRISRPDPSAGQGSDPGKASLSAEQSQERITRSQPEAFVDYDPGKVNPRQIAGTISSLGLLPTPLP